MNFMSDTGTLTPLTNQREYSEVEEIILTHFFTNLDKNIYAATHNMPSPLWAFFVGQYSRTHLSMRDRFLAIFDDMKTRHEKGQISRDNYITKEEMAEAIKRSGEVKLSFFLKRAETFLEKWGIDFGHASLKDADYVRFAIEGISQLATNPLEMPDPSLGAYQEKSTRYIPFGKKSVIIPPVLLHSPLGELVKENNNGLMESYEKWLEPVRQFLREEVFDKKQFNNDAVFNRTVNAKAFDILRYLLPQGLATSLGSTWPTRIAESHISFLMSHPLEEIRMIGNVLKKEGTKITSGLLKHVGESAYFRDTLVDTDSLASDFLFDAKGFHYYIGDKNTPRVKLLRHTENLENILLASILFDHSDRPIDFEEVYERAKQLNDSERDNILETYVGKRGPHDLMMRALTIGSFTFQFIMDNGAWRDVKRHRVGTHLKPKITAEIGYAYPEFLEDARTLRPFKEEFDSLMVQTSEVYRRVKEEFPHEAPYIPAMAHYGASIYEFSPRQAQYVVELRTPPQGHHSYRTLFQDVYKEIEGVIPRVARYIRVNFEDSTLGRRKAEETTEAKGETLEE